VSKYLNSIFSNYPGKLLYLLFVGKVPSQHTNLKSEE